MLLEEPLKRWVTHTIDKQVLAVGRRPQFYATWCFPNGCLSILPTWPLVSPEWVIPQRAKLKQWCLSWPHPRGHISPLPQILLVTQVIPTNVWEENTQRLETLPPRGKSHWAPSLNLPPQSPNRWSDIMNNMHSSYFSAAKDTPCHRPPPAERQHLVVISALKQLTI